MLLVTGATGTIGRPLIDILINEGVKVRAVTHGPQAADLPAEVEVVQGGLARPAAIAPFPGGVTGLFLHPRAVGQAAGELLRPARRRGVRRVVVLSAMNVDDPLDQQPSRYNGDRNKEVEDATVQSGLEVERILGRPARTYARWVADHAAAFPNQQPAGSNR